MVLHGKLGIKKLKSLDIQGISGFWSKLRPHHGGTTQI